MSLQRVVVTGMGVICSLGDNLNDFSQAIFSGKSGITILSEPEFASLPVRYAARISHFDVEQIDYDKKIIQHMDLFALYGMHAAAKALEHSGLLGQSWSPDRFGVCFGSGIGGLKSLETQKERLQERGPRAISPFFIPSMLINMTAGHIATRYGFKGPISAPSTACASSAHALIQGYDWIRTGQADMVLVGGSENACTPLGIAGFAASKALSSRFHDQPEKASRPFDTQRDGFVIADGSAALVLESYEHALHRDATIFAEVIGTGLSCDAYHMTNPDPQGLGASLAISKALQQACLPAEELGAVNLHATSTIRGDQAEIAALRQALGAEILPLLPLSATKSMTGHLLGASAALEAVISILSLQRQELPPSCHIQEKDKSCHDAHLIMNKSLPYVFQSILSNSFGFGGVNAAIIFSNLSANTN
jgi:3-oxoacyl-[acyl-carrier-protein] synthase II